VIILLALIYILDRPYLYFGEILFSPILNGFIYIYFCKDIKFCINWVVYKFFLYSNNGIIWKKEKRKKSNNNNNNSNYINK
jgi:hypothetical protein